MGGLGEASSHIAAILVYLETVAKLNGVSSCTQEKFCWVVPYTPNNEIDLSSAKRKAQDAKHQLN